MPVWHAATEAERTAGRLVVLGLVQEQHADRARLFAQWQGLDWPILHDPFNVTRASVVPNVYALDEHGVVRAVGPEPEWVTGEFLAARYEAPAAGGAAAEAGPGSRGGADEGARDRAGGGAGDAAPDGTSRGAEEASDGARLLLARAFVDAPLSEVGPSRRAMARALWGGAAAYDEVVRTLAEHAVREGAEPIDLFRLGVAHRLRYDSAARRGGDFQASIDAWAAALARDPNQYIWRRRLQQYGPRLDKPYPFYDWIETARAELRARGEEPVPVLAHLTGAELAGPARALEGGAAEDVDPDPRAAITRDAVGLVALETAVATHTGGGAGPRGVRVHLVLRPAAEREVHWTNDAGPTTVWLEPPAGWRLERQRHELPRPSEVESTEARWLDVEVGAAEGAGAGVLRGYALYFVCEGERGACVHRRLDFEVALPAPR